VGSSWASSRARCWFARIPLTPAEGNDTRRLRGLLLARQPRSRAPPKRVAMGSSSVCRWPKVARGKETRVSAKRNLIQRISSRLLRHRPTPRWTPVEAGPLAGASLYLDQEAFIGWKEMVLGRYDKFIYEAISRELDPRGLAVWDVGAHIGYHSLCFASLVGDEGSVHAFEPNPFNQHRFQIHLSANPDLARRITLHPHALAERHGESDLLMSSRVDDSQSSGSRIAGIAGPLPEEQYAKFKRLKVSTKTVDEMILEGFAPPPGLIKLDVEGSEGEVLRGGKATLVQHKPLLVMEIHNVTQMFEAMTLLGGIGYRLEMLDATNAELSRCFLMGIAR